MPRAWRRRTARPTHDNAPTEAGACRIEALEQIAAAGLEEYLRPAGVTVIEWAERWLDQVQSLKSGIQSLESGVGSRVPRLRRVRIEVLSETERRINYEDPGA